MHELDREILAAWPGLSIEAGAYGTGLINRTAKGSLEGRPVIVQRVHPAFAPPVHSDIETITAHLERMGVTTPRLIRTARGELCAIDREGRPWRVQTFIEGSHSHDRIESAAMAAEAGAAVGRFHAALSDLQYDYAHVRPGIHDVPFRERGLEAALRSNQHHPLHGDVAREADGLRAWSGQLVALGATRARHAHGDLKASNVLFDADGVAICLVDLDTLAKMQWPFELGDAIRSWCNPRREDEPGAAIDLDLFEAALRGYAAGAAAARPEPLEIELLARGVLTIATELAMRFLTDALEERYFSFDPSRFATRGAQNLARARGQLELARSIVGRLAPLERASVQALRPQ